MIETYRRRRDYVYGRLVEMGMEVQKPQGAFYLFPSIQKYGMDSETFSSADDSRGQTGGSTRLLFWGGRIYTPVLLLCRR